MILHERWFTDEALYPVQFGTWSSANSLIPIGIALGITLAATLIWRARDRHSVVPGPVALGMPWENYVTLLTWVPLVIGVHMGVTLLVSGVTRQLFIPNLVLPVNLLGGVLGMIEIAIALSFIYGALARPAAAMLALLWLIRLLLENRRWGRLLQLQSDVHGKLIERFATNQELLHYMETEPGKRYLEAAPIPMEFETQQKLPGGLARVLGSLQIGIVLSLLGIGLMILRHSLTDIADALLVFGMVALMPGIGFIISAIISWRISARLGLLPQPVTGGTRPDEQR